MTTPPIRYATADDGAAIAYTVVGDAPLDLVYIQGFVSNVELIWDCRQARAFLERLASFSRLIVVDRRGVGLSDRFSADQLPPLEVAADDVRAVLRHADSFRASILGHHEGGQLAVMLAAAHPEVVESLILYSTPISPEGWGPDVADQSEDFRRSWGTRAFEAELLAQLAPSYRADAELAAFLARFMRNAASPGSAAGFVRLLYETDISGALASIDVPTVVLHRTGDATNPIEGGRTLASRIRGARFVELDGDDWWPFLGDADALAGEVENAVTGRRSARAPERSLAAVLFTDIVGSTARAAAMGDSGWRAILEAHHDVVRAALARHGGVEVDTAGDGFYATFDGPGRATRCALDVADAVRSLGIEIRGGVHVGEVERIAGKPSGTTVNIGARIAALAEPSEVLVSSTVRELSAGSGLAFEDGRDVELKGVPGTWRIHRASRRPAARAGSDT